MSLKLFNDSAASEIPLFVKYDRLKAQLLNEPCNLLFSGVVVAVNDKNFACGRGLCCHSGG
jgi:hypothetical protein